LTPAGGFWNEAVIKLLLPGEDCSHMITGENGKEFAEYERIAQELGINLFFAHPFAAWERGANENMNGLVRQDIPKNRGLISLNDIELLCIMKAGQSSKNVPWFQITF